LVTIMSKYQEWIRSLEGTSEFDCS
jgi:hypothetical protein